jgi:hypothetical protein
MHAVHCYPNDVGNEIVLFSDPIVAIAIITMHINFRRNSFGFEPLP